MENNYKNIEQYFLLREYLHKFDRIRERWLLRKVKYNEVIKCFYLIENQYPGIAKVIKLVENNEILYTWYPCRSHKMKKFITIFKQYYTRAYNERLNELMRYFCYDIANAIMQYYQISNTDVWNSNKSKYIRVKSH